MFGKSTLTGFNFRNCKLKDVVFYNSLLDNIEIKNLILYSISLRNSKTSKKFSKKGVLLIVKHTSIEKSDTFLKEII